MTHKPAHTIAALSLYARHRHLTNSECAAVIGRTRAQVKDFRRHHPEVAYMSGAVAPKPTADRPHVIQLAIPMADPCRSSSVSAVPVMRVSLPAPPWGGGFERCGVKA